MRIAVVGAGVSGLAAAYLLAREHEVVVYEAADRLGGHTDTHDVEVQGRRYCVDTGFIVCNRLNYPLFFALLGELGVATKPTTMSFAVRDEASGLEYNAGTNGGLFVQKRRLFSPRHWLMIRDILRFYREAPALLDAAGDPTLAELLAQRRYSAAFRDDHIVPMASALWSSPSAQVLEFPAKYLVAFMANHHMLQVEGRPEWRVVEGGSTSYVRALTARWTAKARVATPVRSVARRGDGGVDVRADGGAERYDQVVLACHSDQALALLDPPSAAEREVLGAIGYQFNDTVLHTDPNLLPRDPRAWAAWNALKPREPGAACTVSYCMNLLQGIDAPAPLVVTLNCTDAIDPAKILARRAYHHPIYTRASVAAQGRRAQINGVARVWYAGAYWGWGFHEDGMRSAVDVAQRLGVAWP